MPQVQRVKQMAAEIHFLWVLCRFWTSAKAICEETLAKLKLKAFDSSSGFSFESYFRLIEA